MTVDGPERTMSPEDPDGPAGTATEVASGPAGAHGSADASGSGFGWLVPPSGSRSRRSAVRIGGALGIAVAFAVVVGLLIALLAAGIDDSSDENRALPPALTIPSGGAAGGPTQVPPDWTPQTSSGGIAFAAPPGWTQRTDALVDFRVAPAPEGGPGVEQVGVGLSSSTDPQTAAADYARNTYSSQPNYLEQPAADEAGARGERGRQVTVTYSRDGVPVQVVVRAFPTPRGVLLLASRAPADNQQRAVELISQLDSSVKLP